MSNTPTKYSACPMRRVMSIVGSKWKPIVIWVLRERTARFGQIAAAIEVVSRKVLTDTLQELEADGLVLRKEHAELAQRVEYSLTPRGKALLPILHQLVGWNEAEYPLETATHSLPTTSAKSCR
jgi:DNA-binding HxlR family transcriptional regulator